MIIGVVRVPAIKFTHRYRKLVVFNEGGKGIYEVPTKAKLLAVFRIAYSDLGEGFIEYDTTYEENGIAKRYALPTGELLCLLFQTLDGKGFFTTLRRSYPAKDEYYKSQRGKVLEVVVSND